MPSWNDLGFVTLEVKLFVDEPAVKVLAAHPLDADRSRLTCTRFGVADVAGAGIFTATINPETPLPLTYGVDGVYDDEDLARLILTGERARAVPAPRLITVLPPGTDGHVAHSVIEALSTRWPSMELRGTTEGNGDVEIWTVG